MQWSVNIGLDSSVVEHLTGDAVVCGYLTGQFSGRAPEQLYIGMQWSVNIGLDSSVVEHLTGDAVVCGYLTGQFSGRAPEYSTTELSSQVGYDFL